MTRLLNQKNANSTRRGFLKTTVTMTLGSATLAGVVGTGTQSIEAAAATPDVSTLPRVKQTMVAPPFLPEHEQVAVGGPKIVEVTFVIEEKKMVIDSEGTEVWALTFNGSVPGPMIVVHEGDYVELTLKNLATNLMEHNIDFHASTGALGGGALTKVLPGEQAILRWKAVKQGVFVYHCAPGDIMIPYHVVHGMNGAVMVLPRDGLKDGKGNPLKYDIAYYIGEQDYYIPRDEQGAFKKYETAGENLSEALDVMKTLTPTHVVFNGAAGALTGDAALKAKVGETVLFIHAQANRDTRPHLIGGHGDYVWETGSFADMPATGLETWFIRGGSAGAMLYKFRQPGIYAYVNHNLIEAVMLGATAHVVVDGEWDDDLMMQVSKPVAYTN
jgi:nitrite reductase (NO-forming)